MSHSTTVNIPVLNSFVLEIRGLVTDAIFKRGPKRVEDLSEDLSCRIFGILYPESPFSHF
jgi:hypothetical protein